MEELYEELPNEQDEELYEDLPCSYGDDPSFYPGGGAYNGPSPPTADSVPPPLPTSAIPQRPGGAQPTQASQPPPPLPTRSPSTSLTTSTPSSTKTLPASSKKPDKQAAKKKTATLNKLGGGGGGGISMSEIMEKARSRNEKALLDLERKKDLKEDGEGDKPLVPWANQLRKTARPISTSDEIVNGHDTNNDVPEFIKKRKALGSGSGDSSPPTAPKPIAAPKPVRMPTPSTVQPKTGVDGQHPEVQEKPAWMKQRERQANLSKMTPDTKPPPPTTKPPPPASKPPPPSPLERNKSPNRSPPPLKKKPKPVPIPRKPSSENLLYPLPTRTEVKEAENHIQESPPSTPSSVRERAKTLERSMGSVSSTPPQSPKPPPPKPIPRAKPVPLEKPALPVKDVSPSLPPKGPPQVPVRNNEPPPLPPPNKSPAPPPIPSKDAPPSPSPSFPFPPVTRAEPTPPTGSVVKFRRLPLQSVDLFNPPALPSRNSKPALPVGAIEPLAEEDEIYDDTVGLPDQPNGILEDGPEDLYDDVERVSERPPPPTSAPPPSRPPAPTTPPPGPPTEAPPPLPSSAPPSKRPPTSPYETQEFSGGGEPNGQIPIIEEDQETYEDVTPYADRAMISASIPTTSTNSLVPPSPQHSVSSLEHEASPTLSRKQKLTKDEKKQLKEEEKREKERKRLEKEREKERKKKEEIRMKNRQKGIKAFKQFQLPTDIQPLFTIEILLDHPKTKDHLNVTTGEIAFVLLLKHDKLPSDKYLVEKEDGTLGLVSQKITQRTAYQSASASIGSTSPTTITSPVSQEYPEPEDIYESLPQDEEDFGPPVPGGPPAPGVPLPNAGGFRYPAPTQAPPPPPPTDGPEETYEELPDQIQDGY